ncbi:MULTISPECIES: hypothetical protein [Staphylococcus]|uniref:Uncharacterized protein n=1 Tax=Staphylococcus xylosus TaxID=1288 RepID=A0A418IKX4_STAXY|nr:MULTISPECIES: hypothetical protein [Staphylococcus]MDW8543695.1 hypothetical protein [Staphylococcus sp. KG4-1]MDW8563130.1 hypothetical protein [Staphylococcus sp. KG4-3]NQD98997.1 hypothetical protein [Staphylococcus xylosus]PTI04527.1 hypothetical protein BU096_11640 [Staphylococcus xylosus]RIN08297.1 hypothetical protein BU097_12040 [Staphylococcus xylosus]
MTKAMYVHHIINIVLMIVLIIFNNTDIGGLTLSIILAVVFITNTVLLIRENSKKVRKEGITIEEHNKK